MKIPEEHNRIIGRYEGEGQGPLFICLGAMHGNEPAGVKAIELVLKMLEVEPIRHPQFRYRGNFVGLVGNLKAYQEGKRFIDKDLNRSFNAEKLDMLKQKNAEDLKQEDKEFLGLDKTVRKLIDKYDPSEVILLDLHTTSSHGGIFTICRDIDHDIELGKAMHAPIVLGMLEGLQGTTLHYFVTEHLGVKTTPITFESGQHVEGLSVTRAVAGIINCMKAIGSIAADVVENHHEDILIKYSESLPKVTRLFARHAIVDNDGFTMNPGYLNFQKVFQGEIVGENKNGPVTIETDGRILMPLYQKQGEDGFFLVKEVSEKEMSI